MSARHAGSNNIFRLLNVIRAVVPLLRQQGSGHILNISGMVGQFSFPLASIYHATKYAVEGISESLAKKVGAFGIKVTIIEPGAFKTGFRRPLDDVRGTDRGLSTRLWNNGKTI